MSKTSKEEILSIISPTDEESRREFEELKELLEEFNEDQLKEIYEALMVDQRTPYDIIFDFHYNIFNMLDL